jgi:hypothetical protein
MKTNNQQSRFRSTRALYLMTFCAALAVAVVGFLQFSGTGVSAQKLDRANLATPEMIDYALTYKANDAAAHFSIMNQLPCAELDSLSGKALSAGVYCVDAGTLSRELTLDGEGNDASIFIFRVKGALKTSDAAGITLENGARSANVHFVADSVEIGGGSQFKGNILTDKAISVADGASVKGHLRSVSSQVNVSDNAVNAPEEPGFIEICKAAADGSGAPAPLGLGGRTFNFTITAANGTVQTVPVVVGACSGPISVEQGTASIVESSAGESNTSGGFQLIQVNTLTQNASSTVGTINLAARTVSVNVGMGGISSELALQFVNQTAITGFIEICKEAALNGTTPDPDITGMFTFNIQGVFTTNPATGARTLTPFTAAAGQCTGAIAVTIPTAGFPPFADVIVSERPPLNGLSALEDITALNNREIGPQTLGQCVNTAGTLSACAGGGSTVIRVFAGDATQEALVTFINRSAPSIVKVCKVAGPGIPVGTDFSFVVTGTTRTGTGTNADPFVFAPVTRNIIVAAGNATAANPSGNCEFVGTGTGADAGTTIGPFQQFVTGTSVRVDEIAPRDITTNNSSNGFRPGEVRTSSITSSTGQITTDLVRTDTRISRGTFIARREVDVVTFTNFTFRPATLKICKVGTGTVAGTGPFNFTVTQTNPNLPAQTANATVLTAGTAENGGNCVVVGGSANPTIFNANATFTVQETTAGNVTNIVCNTCGTAGSQPAFQFVPTTNSNPLNPGRTITLGTAGNNSAGLQGLRTDVTINTVTFTNGPAGTVGTLAEPFDFDGDGKADLSTFTASNGTWRILGSNTGLTTTQFGTTNDRIVPADFDGDGKTDIAVYRAGVWFIQQSRDGFKAIQFGDANDIAQPADFDGDGRADIAVFRPSNGIWYILGSTAGFSGVQFGSAADRPVVGDYDGDNKADVAVFRPSNGVWYILRSTAGFTGIQFGASTDRAVPADFDGDNKTDIAVYRDGSWFIQGSTSGFQVIQFGNPTDRPVAADYNGDGKADISVYRDGMWYIRDSAADQLRSVQFGTASDIAVPASLLQ